MDPVFSYNNFEQKFPQKKEYPEDKNETKIRDLSKRKFEKCSSQGNAEFPSPKKVKHLSSSNSVEKVNVEEEFYSDFVQFNEKNDIEIFFQKKFSLIKEFPNLINLSPQDGIYKGTSFFSRAAEMEAWDAVSEMLNFFPDVNVGADDNKATPFLLAMCHGQWDIVEKMLSHHNPDVNAIVAEGQLEGATPLLLAAFSKKWNVVLEMLEYTPNLKVSLAQGPYAGKTPLFLAVWENQWAVVEKMLQKNMNPDVNTGFPYSPLLLSAFRNKWDIVSKMLKYNPDINFAAITEQDKGTTPFLLAVLKGQWDVVSKMLQYNPNVNANSVYYDGRGVTPLMQVLKKEKWELVLEMLKHNPDVNAPILGNENKGMTPLMKALIEMKAEAEKEEKDIDSKKLENLNSIVLEMLKHNPDVNAAIVKGPNKGVTPLLMAAYSGNWELLSKMLKYNPDVNAASVRGPNRGVTPFFMAAYCGNWEMVLEMLKYNPNVNAAPPSRIFKETTPLLLLAFSKKCEIISQALKMRQTPGILSGNEDALALKKCFQGYEERINNEKVPQKTKAAYQDLINYILLIIGNSVNVTDFKGVNDVKENINDALLRINAWIEENFYLNKLPQEVQMKIAVESLCQTIPELEYLGYFFLEKVIQNSLFMSVLDRRSK